MYDILYVYRENVEKLNQIIENGRNNVNTKKNKELYAAKRKLDLLKKDMYNTQKEVLVLRRLFQKIHWHLENLRKTYQKEHNDFNEEHNFFSVQHDNNDISFQLLITNWSRQLWNLFPLFALVSTSYWYQYIAKYSLIHCTVTRHNKMPC